MEKRAVIIGSGAAAVECVDELRRNGFHDELHLFSDTADPPYNPMLTTYYALGKIDYDGMFPYGTGDDFWYKRGVIFHGEDPVQRLDAEARTVTSERGITLSFGKCLIASGAAPLVPPLPGLDGRRIYTVRTAEDAVRLKKAVDSGPKRVVVIGASMVGIKVMELFNRAGSRVCLADMAPHIFPLSAHSLCADEIESRLKKQGITLRFGTALSSVKESGEGVSVSFGDGETEEGDLAVVCIGVRPNIGFIDPEQIAVDRGVLVDKSMETSVPGIYAAGDVAQGYNILTGERQIIGLWASARSQGRTAGRNMAGICDRYHGTVLHNITHFMNMDFIGLGNIRDYDHMDVEKSSSGGMTALFWKEGALCGANFLDRYAAAGILKNRLMKGGLRNSWVSVPPSSALQEKLIGNLLKEVRNHEN